MAANRGNLVRTGLAGLDEIFLGGILRGNAIVVAGESGTGKSILGTAFIYKGITEFDEPGLIVLFETAPHRFVRDAACFGWDLDGLQAQNKLKIIFTSPQVLDQELRSADSVLLETAASIGAERIFIDGISLLRDFQHGNGHGNNPNPYREVLQQLLEGLQRQNLTAMLSHERTIREDPAIDIAQFLADTVIILHREPSAQNLRRTLEIAKSRGQDYDSGRHTLRIGDDGPQVFRRVQAPPRHEEEQPSSHARRSIIGVEGLDALFGGGVFDGSTTMVVGASGAGKTVFGIQLLLEGAIRQGRPGLLVSLDEHPAQIIRNAETMGLDLRQQIQAGTIKVYFESPQELDIDFHFHKIIREIETHKIQRLLINGMTSYSMALQNDRLYRDFFHALVAYTKQHLITTFFNYENRDFAVTNFMPELGVSSLVDNIVLLNLVELGDTLHRAITVTKARGSNHQFVTRKFQIGQGGISLL